MSTRVAEAAIFVESLAELPPLHFDHQVRRWCGGSGPALMCMPSGVGSRWRWSPQHTSIRRSEASRVVFYALNNTQVGAETVRRAGEIPTRAPPASGTREHARAVGQRPVQPLRRRELSRPADVLIERPEANESRDESSPTT